MFRFPSNRIPLLIALPAILLLSGFRRAPQSADDIIAQSLQAHALKTRAEMIKMVTLDASGKVDTREVLRLVRHTSPTEMQHYLRLMGPFEIEGVTLLSIQKDGSEEAQYLYMPTIDSVRRIAPSGRRGFFVGSDFAYEDFMVEDPDAFSYERMLDGSIDGESCFVISAKPKGEDWDLMTNYGQRVIYVTKEDLRIVQVDFYGKNRDLIKSLKLEEFAPVMEETRIPKRLEMVNHERESRSMFVATETAYNIEIPARFFDPDRFHQWNEQTRAEVDTFFASAR